MTKRRAVPSARLYHVRMRAFDCGLLPCLVLLSLAPIGCSDSTSANGPSSTVKTNGSVCEPTAQGASTCAGGVCVKLKANDQNLGGICSQTCATTDDCTVGGVCVAAGSTGSICLITCGSNQDCSDGFVCVPGGDGNSYCLVTVPVTGTKPNGRVCEPTAQGASTCAGGVCLQLNANQQNLAGICSESCTTTANCTAGGVCVAAGTVGSVCLISCTSSQECSDGFVCAPGGDGNSYCLVTASGSTDAGTD